MSLTLRESKWTLQELVGFLIKEYYSAIYNEDVKKLESIIMAYMSIISDEEAKTVEEKLQSFKTNIDTHDDYEKKKELRKQYLKHLTEVIYYITHTRTIRNVLEDIRTTDAKEY